MNDMRGAIIPKSDQINTDDLLAGPITITIREVTIRGGTEQPVSIHFDGDGGKPWKPCKSMSRVLVHAWGPDANKYIGRSASLYADPKVTWAGMQVGGIRISHLSHIEREMMMALTATKGKRAPFVVKPLKESARKADASGADGASATGPQTATQAPSPSDSCAGASSAAYTGDEPVYEVRNGFGDITEMLTGPLYLVAMDKLWADAATAQNEQELLAIYEQNAEAIAALPEDLKTAMRKSYKLHKDSFGKKGRM